MKKLMMMFAAMMLTAMTVNAQSNDSVQHRKVNRTEMVKNRTDRFVKQYGLNETQAQQLLQLNTVYADKMPGMGRRGMGNRNHQGEGQNAAPSQTERPSKEQMEARMKEMKANMDAYNAELKKILTSDQYAKYQEAQQKRMQRRGQGGPRPDGNFGNGSNDNNNSTETE
ncbi:MAG: DUF4890 domain-containing protein [Prevotella sp.]|nr:DUF4890 domain-containing protein [Prevotella sp.]